MAAKSKNDGPADERPEIPDRSFALGRKVAEPIEYEAEVIKTETRETPEIPIRPEQTPKKRTGLEEADSDRSRGDDIAPKDYDNTIVRGETEDPLDDEKKEK